MRAEIIYVLDRSGSMAPLASDCIGGFNQFVEEQRKVPGEARLTLVLFDHEYQVPVVAAHLDAVPEMVSAADDSPGSVAYIPRGSTALLDAIGKTLDCEGRRISRDKWADKVIVVVHTDGIENASRDYTTERVKQMTEHATKHGWVFVYMGADQDAFSVAHTMGMANVHTNSYVNTSAGIRQSYAHSSGTVAGLRATP